MEARLIGAAKAECEAQGSSSWIMITDDLGNTVAEEPAPSEELRNTALMKALAVARGKTLTSNACFAFPLLVMASIGLTDTLPIGGGAKIKIANSASAVFVVSSGSGAAIDAAIAFTALANAGMVRGEDGVYSLEEKKLGK